MHLRKTRCASGPRKFGASVGASYKFRKDAGTRVYEHGHMHAEQMPKDESTDRLTPWRAHTHTCTHTCTRTHVGRHVHMHMHANTHTSPARKHTQVRTLRQTNAHRHACSRYRASIHMCMHTPKCMFCLPFRFDRHALMGMHLVSWPRSHSLTHVHTCTHTHTCIHECNVCNACMLV
jgi:hypothetical protein